METMKKIGLITLGQSPRTDILSEMTRILGSGYEMVEAGALDGHTLKEIKKLEIGPEGTLLMTRMRARGVFLRNRQAVGIFFKIFKMSRMRIYDINKQYLILSLFIDIYRNSHGETECLR